MKKYDFCENNKKSIDDLPNWSLETLIGSRDVAIREIENLTPTCHPDFIEMIHCAKEVLEFHIKLKTQQQQRSTEEV